MEKKEIGKISHYFGKIGVATIRLSDSLKDGDTISIEGAHTNFEQVVESMRLDKTVTPEAVAGQEVGTKVKDRVREGDTVFKVIL